MKFTCKLLHTKLTFRVETDGDTVGHLRNAVSAIVNCKFPKKIDRASVPFEISLNGKESLTADSETALTDVGLVSGDLLHIIIADEDFLMGSSHEIGQKRSSNLRMLCCEATPESIPHSLMQEFRADGNVRSIQEAVIVALHVLMAEAGFVKQSKRRVSSTAGVYCFGYCHDKCPTFLGRLVCTSMADMLMVHGLNVSDDDNSRVIGQLALVCSEYVTRKTDLYNADVTDVYKNLKHLSCTFKSAIVVPLLQALAESADYVGTGLMTMPSEIQLQILKHLDVASLVKVSVVCSHLHRLSNDQLLWRRLCIRDFPKAVHDDRHGSNALDSKQCYEDMYRKAKQETMVPSVWARIHGNRTFNTGQLWPPIYPNLPVPPPRSFDLLGGDYDRYPHLPGFLPPVARPWFDLDSARNKLRRPLGRQAFHPSFQNGNGFGNFF